MKLNLIMSLLRRKFSFIEPDNCKLRGTMRINFPNIMQYHLKLNKTRLMATEN